MNNANQCNAYETGTTSTSSPSDSECTNACDNGYAVNPKVTTSCLCALPVVGSINFLATKVPILTDSDISLIETDLAFGLTVLLINSTSISLDQVVVSVISYNEISVSVFPPSNVSSWSPTVATFIAFHIKSQEISLDEIGPLVCQFNGNPYGAGTSFQSCYANHPQS